MDVWPAGTGEGHHHNLEASEEMAARIGRSIPQPSRTLADICKTCRSDSIFRYPPISGHTLPIFHAISCHLVHRRVQHGGQSSGSYWKIRNRKRQPSQFERGTVTRFFGEGLTHANSRFRHREDCGLEELSKLSAISTLVRDHFAINGHRRVEKSRP